LIADPDAKVLLRLDILPRKPLYGAETIPMGAEIDTAPGDFKNELKDRTALPFGHSRTEFVASEGLELVPRRKVIEHGTVPSENPSPDQTPKNHYSANRCVWVGLQLQGIGCLEESGRLQCLLA